MSQTTTTGEPADRRRSRRALRPILVVPIATALAMTPLAANAATVRPNVSCNWNSYVQLLTPDGNLLTPPNNGRSVSDPFYWNLDFQGVMNPGSSAVLAFTNTATGQLVLVGSNDVANGNCVLNMEPNVFAGTRIGIGTWSVQATFEPWEIGYYISEPMGTLTLS